MGATPTRQNPTWITVSPVQVGFINTVNNSLTCLSKLSASAHSATRRKHSDVHRQALLRPQSKIGRTLLVERAKGHGSSKTAKCSSYSRGANMPKDPTQPRVPKGFNTGGQFTVGGTNGGRSIRGSSAGSDRALREPRGTVARNIEVKLRRKDLRSAARNFRADPFSEKSEDQLLETALDFAATGVPAETDLERAAVNLAKNLGTPQEERAFQRLSDVAESV